MPYKNKISGIYIITCMINNKYYIGKANNCLHRLNQHQVALRNNRHHSFHLQRAYNKYGKENFTFEILEECPTEHLFSMEHYWINMLYTYNRKYGYNISIPNGRGGFATDKLTREKQSKARTGMKLSETTKDKLRQINKGKTLSKENLDILQEGGRLYRQTEKYKKDLCKRKEKVGIKIVLYNIETKKWKKFESVIDASNSISGDGGQVYECIDIPSRSVKGHLVFSEGNFNPNLIYNKQKRTSGKKKHRAKVG